MIYRTSDDVEVFTLRELKEIAFQAVRLVRILDEKPHPANLELAKVVLCEYVHEAQKRVENERQL